MILPLIGALAVGLSLGILGSGGSILTVPILIYMLGEPKKVAIAESLGIVGFIALTGFIPYALQKKVHWKSVLLFGLPGMAGAYFGAFLAHYILAEIQLLIFAGIMLLASVMMFRDQKPDDPSKARESISPWWIILQGIGVGTLTGLIGVGGGFLIVPALVLLGGLPMNLAVGTSLVIVTMQSATGFVKYLDVLGKINLSINVHFMIIFGLIGAVGSFTGKKISSKISNERLKKGFAIFLIFMGSYIIYKNI
ncbi:MAG TPA: sulfite exporter TauE/SafE family protein [Balneolaceae bacterium]|nr:sulfite exporter TauE/SafE family protein [Balneolaceae bacterium]